MVKRANIHQIGESLCLRMVAMLLPKRVLAKLQRFVHPLDHLDRRPSLERHREQDKVKGVKQGKVLRVRIFPVEDLSDASLQSYIPWSKVVV
jgi:hypothetical protein